jgi:hypothetical protein
MSHRAAAMVERTRAPRTVRAAKKAVGRPQIDIITACQDPDIFGPWFKDAQTWAAWFVVLKVMFGLGLDDDELALFRKHTGRTTPDPSGYFDLSLIAGRRGGKSLVLALTAASAAFLIGGRS